GDAALAAVPSRLEAPVVALGRAHEDGALRGVDTHLIEGHGDTRRRELGAGEPRPQPADDARVGRVGDLEGARRPQRAGIDRDEAAAELDEDEDDDAEGDGELQREGECGLHGGGATGGYATLRRAPQPESRREQGGPAVRGRRTGRALPERRESGVVVE